MYLAFNSITSEFTPTCRRREVPLKHKVDNKTTNVSSNNINGVTFESAP